MDLGCGHADISGVLYRLGADVTAVDSRAEHLKIVSKKFSGIKVAKADLDRAWPYVGKKFDMILDLGLTCHLSSYADHLRAVCASTTHLVLEMSVCDSEDPEKFITVPENKGIYDLAANGVGCRPSAAAVEKILKECGMNFRRVDSAKFNSGDYTYDWWPKNDGNSSLEKRRIWFAVKATSPIQFAHANSEIIQPNASPFPNPPDAPISSTPFLPKLHNSGIPGTRPNEVVRSRDGIKPYSASKVSRSQIINQFPNIPYNSADKKFVIVIPSYNNKNWCEKNIQSSLNQDYTNYRIIFTDDCSSDGTFEKVAELVKNSSNANRVTLVKNTVRIGALANLYNMIHSCKDDEIILTLDGDDWLANNNVLNILNRVYSDNDFWVTYGQYQNSSDGGRGISQPYPRDVVDNTSFRQYTWCASHLRTFYSWIFKKIKKEDLQQNGEFYSMTWDFAIMFPMLEMAGTHSAFISDILYIYNLDNPINDHKVNISLQQNLDRHLRGKEKYQRVEKPTFKSTKVGLMLIATGKYQQFIQGLINSADTFFLKDGPEVTYYLFSDTSTEPLSSQRNIINIPIEHKPFPFASMERFKHFINNANALSQEDYLYYVDVDCLFVDYVNSEILGDLVGVRHCGYINKMGPYENNSASCLYVDDNYTKKYKYYYGGGFSGGKNSNYLTLAKWCSEKIEQDVANNIIPLWHDETALNRYFLDNEPNIALSPSYHYPQSNIEHFKNIWAPDDWPVKILLLDKDHQNIRK